ncbi:winged helix-turn-helix domain-containing protein [Arthrobacter celericrescens]|uniref:winged helix-turn-helix domain-containing protein n=1 Tax=Arthrobacter celericrescens TaxID=2320851 RepID=UPI003CCAF3A5
MNRTRSQIIRFLLRSGPSTCGEIGDGVGASPSSVRRQLGILQDAGLVKGSFGHFVASPHDVHLHVEAFASGFQAPSCCRTSLTP